jgi:hypothetical protein
MASNVIELKEFNFNLIKPNEQSIRTSDGGSKITIIGKPRSGKSVLIKALLNAKKHLIPIGIAISATENTNKFYSKLFPDLFIYDEFKLSIIEALKKRQTLAKEHLQNSWAVLIMDDCMDNVSVFNDPIMIGLMKNSRHWNLLSIFANQYVFDFKPSIRTNIDGVFIFREPNLSTRDKIWKNFAGIIPTFKLFCQIMDEITVDHACIYIDNQSTSNKWQDCVYYYTAPLIENFNFGVDEFWQFSENRRKHD